MKIRGQRECTDCGTRWSYYDTGSVECPECGSLRSASVEEDRELHTDSPAELDLTEARQLLDSGSGPDSLDPGALRQAADRAGELAREYVRKRGFVRGGDLLALDETYLAAQELRHAADVVGRGLDLSDDEEWYFLTLLRNADAEGGAGAEAETDADSGSGRDAEDADLRPTTSEVPESMHSIRGLAAADAADEYRREMADWADERETGDEDGNGIDDEGENEIGDEGRNALETLGEHVKRVHALDGEVDPKTADELVAAARDVGRYLRDGDDEALASARERFYRLAD